MMPVLAFAQARLTGGDLSGTVTDSGGGVLPGVTITATHLATNQSQEKKAREEGKRVFDAMHKDADAEIRKYTERKAPAGQPKKDSGREKK